MRRLRTVLAQVTGLALVVHAGATHATSQSYTAPQLFEIAASAAPHDSAAAIRIYKALENDPDRDIRCEARFRHARLLEQAKAWTEAALLLRAILDDNPIAQPARLELAKVLALMGHGGEAQRQLRAAQAGGLPPEVALAVNQFAAALQAIKPVSGTLELGFAPSSNINRATSSPTLNSVLGPLDLSRDAKARSGIGLTVGGQGYAQVPVSTKLALTARLSTQDLLYRSSEYDDMTFGGEVGALVQTGRSRLRFAIGPSYRLYGTRPFILALNATSDWMRSVGKRTQIELESDFSKVTYKTNTLQSGHVLGETLSLERAITATSGAKLSLFGQRTTAADPGCALANAGTSALVWREWGKSTIYANVGISHLTSDARLFLYTDRRREWLTRVSLGATFRQLQVKGFSPLLRMNYERNTSTVGIYAYHRIETELVIAHAF